MEGRSLFDASRQRTATLTVAAAVALVLGAIAFLVLQAEVFYSIDGAVKFIQAEAFRTSGFRSMALPYPGQRIDPDGLFVPFEPPFVFRGAGQYQSIFPSAFALLASLVVGLGPGALRALAIAGGALAAAGSGWLGDRGPRWILPAIVAFATPLWFYATGAGESTIALAASTWAFVVAMRGERGPDRLRQGYGESAEALRAKAEGPPPQGPPANAERLDAVAGLLLGFAAIFRDEALLLLPGLVYARYLTAGRATRWVTLLASVAAPILLMAAVDWVWLDRPPLAHLRHAVSLVNSVLPRARAVLPKLETLTWHERIDTMTFYWWLGDGGWLLAIGVTGSLIAAALMRRTRQGPVIVAAIVVSAVAIQIRDVGPLLAAPKFLTGLLRLAPFFLFACLPSAPGSGPSRTRRVALITTAACTLLTLLSLSTTGGKGLGPRLTMSLWPLLAAAALEGLDSWRRWAGTAWVRQPIVWGGGLLIAGSMVMELGVALPALAMRSHEDQEALALIRQIPDRVVVLDDDNLMQLMGPDYFTREVLFVAREDLWLRLGEALAADGEMRLLVISRRQPRDATMIPPFRFAESWSVSRYWVGRWVR